MIERNQQKQIFINRISDFFNSHTYNNPLYIIENQALKSKLAHLKKLEHTDFDQRSLIINEEAIDVKAYSKQFINFINNHEFDAVFVLGGFDVLELGKYYIHLAHRMVTDFNLRDDVKAPSLIMSWTLDTLDYEEWPISAYPRIIPDYLLVEMPQFQTISIHDLINDALSEFQQGLDQYLFHLLNERARRLTLNAMKLIYTHIIGAYKRRTPESIQGLIVASRAMKRLFSYERIGISHHIAQAIDDKAPLYNPRLNYMLLQQTLKVICLDPQMEKQVSKMAIFFGLDFGLPAVNSVAFIESLKMMQEALDLPDSFSTIGIDNDYLYKHIDQWSMDAVDAIDKLGYNIQLTDVDIRGILLQLT
jgi:hypothetical protein